MAEPKMAKKGPYVIDEKPGKKVWCSCGRSVKQPYCDGTHSGSEFSPEIVHIDAAKSIAWCGCKKTMNPPYCDGTHSKLP
jgi:CDGSH-type Zn-finger protein